jgi:hypothetical protein
MINQRNLMTPIEKKAEKTVAKLRSFYKAGVEANQAFNYGKGTDEEIANKYGRSPSSIAHARILPT